MTVRHVVLFDLEPGVTDEQLAALANGLESLPREIPHIRRLSHGPDLGLGEGNFGYAVVVDFDDDAGYLAYRDHPAHVRIVDEHIHPILIGRTAAQYRF